MNRSLFVWSIGLTTYQHLKNCKTRKSQSAVYPVDIPKGRSTRYTREVMMLTPRSTSPVVYPVDIMTRISTEYTWNLGQTTEGQHSVSRNSAVCPVDLLACMSTGYIGFLRQKSHSCSSQNPRNPLYPVDTQQGPVDQVYWISGTEIENYFQLILWISFVSCRHPAGPVYRVHWNSKIP